MFAMNICIRNSIEPKRLEYLKDKLHILQIDKPAENQLRFTLDPLAEYLASIHLVETLDDSEEKWDDFFKKVDQYSPDKIQGFLLAVQDCIQSEMKESSFSQSILEKLANYINPEI
jgi:hypothetical protein